MISLQQVSKEEGIHESEDCFGGETENENVDLKVSSQYRSTSLPKEQRSFMIDRKQSVRQPAQMDAIIISSIPPKHVHIVGSGGRQISKSPSSGGGGTGVTAELIEWMKQVDLVDAPGCSVSTGTPRHLPESVILNGATVAINPGAHLFIRVVRTVLNVEDRHYQLSMRLCGGSGQVCEAPMQLHSCPSDKHGNIEDWFLVPLEKSLDFAQMHLDIGLERVVEGHLSTNIRSSVTAAFMPRLKSIRARANELLSLGRTPSISAPSSRKASLKTGTSDNQYAKARFPLAMLLQGGLTYGTRDVLEIGGTFYLLRGGLAGWNRKAVGEISLHITTTPDSLAITWPSSTAAGQGSNAGELGDLNAAIKHQGYLTVQVGASRWKRTWALLCGSGDAGITGNGGNHSMTIQLTDYRRDLEEQICGDHQIDPTSIVELADLTSLTATWEGHETGLMGLLVLGFEDGSFVYAIADSAEEMNNWANAISRAVWGQAHVQ